MFDYYKLLFTAIYYYRRPYTTFNGSILLLAAIYYSWRLYTTVDGYIPHWTAIYYFRRLYTTFSFMLMISQFPAISFLCGLNTRLEFNINLLALILFSFFYNSVVSPVNFNLPFWKCCFTRNTQMLKIWIFQALKKRA